jgi:hypothetical protein
MRGKNNDNDNDNDNDNGNDNKMNNTLADQHVGSAPAPL